MFGFFKPLSREKFAQQVLKRIQNKTGLRDTVLNQEEFLLTYGTHQLFLTNLYNEYCHKAAKDRDGVMDHAANFFAESALAREPTFEETVPNLFAVVRERMLVSLSQVNWGIAPLAGNKVPPPVGEPISRWFFRMLAIDAPTHISYVNEEQLQKWNLTFDEAYTLAAANLRAATIPQFKEEAGVHRGQWGDTYDTSRILVPGIFDDLPITGEPVFVLPNRDTLLVADSNDASAIQKMLEQAEQIAAANPRAQNIAPLVLREGEIHDYSASPDSAAHPAITRAQALASLGAYTEQSSILEKVYEREGKDLHVAEHTLLADKSGPIPKYRSYCIWSRDVATLLPWADDVVFYDDTKPEAARAVARIHWDRVVAVLGDLMLDTQMFPARYYVSKFPTDEQIRKLQAAD